MRRLATATAIMVAWTAGVPVVGEDDTVPDRPRRPGITLQLTNDCDCGGESYDYTACDIDVQGGTLEVDNTFKTSGDVDLSGRTLQVDEQFTGKGELDFSGGMIKVAAGKIAAFTPND